VVVVDDRIGSADTVGGPVDSMLVDDTAGCVHCCLGATSHSVGIGYRLVGSIVDLFANVVGSTDVVG